VPAAPAFARDGYVVHRGLFSAAEAAALLDAVRAARGPEDEANELSTGAMRFLSNLYLRSEAVRQVLLDPRILAVVADVLGPDAWCRWDQAVAKGPGAGPFPWHQDNGYTRLDAEHLQVWVALTRSTAEGGGLWVEPGGHRARGRDHRWVGSHAELLDEPAAPVAVDAEAGDVIAFSSFLPHHTSPNRGDRVRWTYVAEFLPLAEADPGVEGPRFVVLRDGRPAGTFEDTTP
jgi:ectoine hydroxylase-related dioxygenase (phytanoyl-CoA dioxygenase family)